MFNNSFFYDKIAIMKHKISLFAILAGVLSANCAQASECVGSECELTPIIIEQDFGQPEITQESWGYTECETDLLTETVSCLTNYECPFDTEIECAIWARKPVYKTALRPRAPHLNPIRVDEILYAIYSNYDITANDPMMSPLLERYTILMNASRACCSEGLIHKMRTNGAKDKQIYQFLKDDANYFAVGTRCMVMNDSDFQDSYSNGVTGKMAIEVRNACLCKNRQWFETLLEPFNDVYERAPMFETMAFPYTYTDDMQREITVYVNDEVHTTMGLLGACPK